jgi:hypothetical protein
MPKPVGPPTAAPPPPTAKPAAAVSKPASPATAPKPAGPKPTADGNGAAPPTDKPAAPAAAPATIDFKCPQCDEPIKIDMALAGKMAPCPECRRIVRVPMPTKKQPTDWRKVATGPSLAKQDTAPVPDGAWGTATTVSTVSREALQEAEAAVGSREPLTRGQKIKRVLITVGVVLVCVGAYFAIKSSITGNDERKALEAAMRDIPKDPLAAAEIHRGVAEFCVRAGGEEDIRTGREHLQVARGKLVSHESSSERDAILADLAVLQADYVLDPTQIEKAQIRQDAERAQERAFKDLESTLALIAAPEAKAGALRLVANKLLAKKLAEQTPRLVGDTGDNRPELTAALALELWRLGQAQTATALADQLLKARAEPKGKDKPAPPSLVALSIVVKRPQEEIDKLKPAAIGGDDFAWRLGQIQGLAMLGDWEKARGMMAGLKAPQDPLCAGLVLAAAAGDKNTSGTADLEQVASWVEANKEMLTPAPNRPNPSWVLLHLTQLALKAGKPELAGTFANAVPDEKLRGRAKLEILRDRLAKTSDKAGDDWADGIEGPAFGLAKEAIARHNTRKGQGSALMKALAGWDEKLRSFGYVGVALGLQDK